MSKALNDRQAEALVAGRKNAEGRRSVKSREHCIANAVQMQEIIGASAACADPAQQHPSLPAGPSDQDQLETMALRHTCGEQAFPDIHEQVMSFTRIDGADVEDESARLQTRGQGRRVLLLRGIEAERDPADAGRLDAGSCAIVADIPFDAPRSDEDPGP